MMYNGFSYYEQVGIQVDELQAVNITAIVADKGRTPYQCQPAPSVWNHLHMHFWSSQHRTLVCTYLRVCTHGFSELASGGQNHRHRGRQALLLHARHTTFFCAKSTTPTNCINHSPARMCWVWHFTHHNIVCTLLGNTAQAPLGYPLAALPMYCSICHNGGEKSSKRSKFTCYLTWNGWSG